MVYKYNNVSISWEYVYGCLIRNLSLIVISVPWGSRALSVSAIKSNAKTGKPYNLPSFLPPMQSRIPLHCLMSVYFHIRSYQQPECVTDEQVKSWYVFMTSHKTKQGATINDRAARKNRIEMLICDEIVLIFIVGLEMTMWARYLWKEISYPKKFDFNSPNFFLEPHQISCQRENVSSLKVSCQTVSVVSAECTREVLNTCKTVRTTDDNDEPQ